MKNIFCYLVVSSFLLFGCLSIFAQGNLTPPGAPTPTMKTLAQIEPRTPISSAPFVISQSGSYYVTTNLNVTSGDVITIATSGVSLDLGGFTLSSTATSPTGAGVNIGNALRNITIQNGFIQGGVTNNGSGTYSGTGFNYGIYVLGNPPANVRVSHVGVAGVQLNGIYIGIFNSAVAESCTVRTVGGYGIYAAVVRSSAVADSGNAAIYGQDVSDSRGVCSSFNGGIYATTAHNCYAESLGTGLLATTANNCYGYSGGNNNYGLSVTTANNCYGESGSNGIGLYANVANNSYGYSPSGYGLYADHIAIGCVGNSPSGTGLFTYIANSCRGLTSSGTALSYNFKYNMP